MQLTATAPRSDSFRRYAAWAPILRHLPGSAGAGWRSGAPNDITVRVIGPGWQRLVENVIDGAVDGARLVIQSLGDDGSGATPPDGRVPFWDRLSFMANAVAALPGVISHQLAGQDGDGVAHAIMFDVIDAPSVAKLDDLVRDELAGMRVIWRVRGADTPAWQGVQRSAPRQ